MISSKKICRETPLRRIGEVAKELGLDPETILLNGHYIAKVPFSEFKAHRNSRQGSLILVTAMTPTPQG
ncbi:MAG: formate--tetrahydrofolate ligase, partial [Chitinispirillaceae bacterium]|nr:formate--tetrahydrofolate ligase [Chitinispirillaceae bacterium]